MKSLTAFSLSVLLTSILGCSPPPTAPVQSPQADLLVYNAEIYAVDPERNFFQAMAVKDGKVLALGSNEEVRQYAHTDSRELDLEGKLVLPGFFDSHAHPVSHTKQLYEVDLYGLKTVEEMQAALRAFRTANPDVPYIKGRGWRDTDFAPHGPDKSIIDVVVSDIPVAFTDEGGHATWVNSKALELAGITAATENPDGGVIARFVGSAEPSGTLRESAAGLVAGLFPYYGFDELRKGLLAYQDMALGFGITGANEAHLDLGTDEARAYRSLEAENLLRMRFRAGLYVDPDRDVEQIQALVEERDRNRGVFFRINGAKIFIDGVIEGGTGYLNEPYEHAPDSHGKLLWDLDRLQRVSAALDEQGFQIHVHAIGDAAARVMLDALDSVRASNGERDARHAITHLQLVTPTDIERFRELGVVALPQPYWFIKDDYYHKIQVPYLGQQRADEEYPMASFFRAGVKVASSSDYPVTIPCNPLVAIETGITRQEPGSGGDDGPLWPEERVGLPEMIESFTINGAYASFLEDTAGSLEIGKSADFIVLDKNLFDIPPQDIHTAKVLFTYLGGEPVYQAP